MALIELQASRHGYHRQSNTLGAHNPVERRTLECAGGLEAQMRQQRAMVINGAFDGPEKGLLQRHPVSALDICGFDLRGQGKQRNSTVSSGQRMGNVPCKRSHISHLWPSDDATAFDQAGSMLDQAFIFGDPAVANCTSDCDLVIFDMDAVEAGYPAGVHHGLYRRSPALLDLQQQIRTTPDHLGPAVIAIERLNRFFDRCRCMVVFPAGFDGSFLFGNLAGRAGRSWPGLILQ
jgi:hypothetical protein